MPKWLSIKKGSIGQPGEEGGYIFKDEEFGDYGHISLERGDCFSVITCGVYGAMLHTVFCNIEDEERVYEGMKLDLGEFFSRETTFEEECDFYADFTEKWR